MNISRKTIFKQTESLGKIVLELSPVEARILRDFWGESSAKTREELLGSFVFGRADGLSEEEKTFNYSFYTVLDKVLENNS